MLHLYFDLVGDAAAEHNDNWNDFVNQGSELWRKIPTAVISSAVKILVVRYAN